LFVLENFDITFDRMPDDEAWTKGKREWIEIEDLSIIRL
jgi:hypothetical protein